MQGKYTYEIIRSIGSGGMGEVFLVHMREEKRCAAMKRVMKSETRESIRELAFAREIRMLKNLHHPGIPAYIDSFEDADARYLVMDYIDGCTLSQSFKEKGLTPHAVKKWMRQVLYILRYLHNLQPRGVLYLDVKPQNIMMSKGKVYLIDFGSACYVDTCDFIWTATPRLCST